MKPIVKFDEILLDDVKIKQMIDFIESANETANGNVFFLDGTKDINFNKFNDDMSI